MRGVSAALERNVSTVRVYATVSDFSFFSPFFSRFGAQVWKAAFFIKSAPSEVGALVPPDARSPTPSMSHFGAVAALPVRGRCAGRAGAENRMRGAGRAAPHSAERRGAVAGGRGVGVGRVARGAACRAFFSHTRAHMARGLTIQFSIQAGE